MFFFETRCMHGCTTMVQSGAQNTGRLQNFTFHTKLLSAIHFFLLWIKSLHSSSALGQTTISAVDFRQLVGFEYFTLHVSTYFDNKRETGRGMSRQKFLIIACADTLLLIGQSAAWFTPVLCVCCDCRNTCSTFSLDRHGRGTWTNTRRSWQSLYGRNKSICSYLPPDLSICKIFRMWKMTRRQMKKKVCSYQKYRQIFCSSFNLGFGNPRQDTGSFYASKIIELRNAAGVKKQKVITELRLHKLRAKKFFEFLRKKIHTQLRSILICNKTNHSQS